ncbi:hypothetical protein, partial [Pseudomonas guariconensis]|uniref:hypothetical protein n=1 Tax=Pseudomonas guariconensis TaxID=1288410 RepID=UPI001E5CA60D
LIAQSLNCSVYLLMNPPRVGLVSNFLGAVQPTKLSIVQVRPRTFGKGMRVELWSTMGDGDGDAIQQRRQEKT